MTQWTRDKHFGDTAATEVAGVLIAHGHHVIDISQLKDSQRRGIDLLVDADYYDVKADRYKAVNFALEDTNNNELGCFWKSRADYWLYYFPIEGKLYRIHLAKAQRFVALSLGKYPTKHTYSFNRDNHWGSTVLLVPIADVLAAGAAEDWTHLLENAA